MRKFLVYCLIAVGAIVVPYICIALITWESSIVSWGWIGRLCFVLWTLAIANATYNKLKKEKFL
jgi:hypothetical protein